jgi:hypothetical protein
MPRSVIHGSSLSRPSCTLSRLGAAAKGLCAAVVI